MQRRPKQWRKNLIAGWSNLVARQAHNLKVGWFKSPSRYHLDPGKSTRVFFYSGWGDEFDGNQYDLAARTYPVPKAQAVGNI